MSYHHKLLFLLIFLIFPTTNCLAAPVDFPNCTGQACLKIAKKINWPNPLKKQAVSIELGKFKLFLPVHPDRIIWQSGHDLGIVVRDTFLEFTTIDSYVEIDPENVEIPAGISYSVAEAAQLTFNQTINNSPPENSSDQWVWNRSMLMKEQHFSEGSQVFTASKNGLTIFLIKSSIGSSYAYIFDEDQKDSYAYIGTGLKYDNFEEFKKIIGSVILK